MQGRLPKFGFASRQQRWESEIRLQELALVEGDVADLDALKKADVIRDDIREAKVILSGELNRPVTVRGLRVTKGAREAITAAGGKVED
jgi:large subunit ribosomal protein L15